MNKKYKFLIIPDPYRLEESLELAEEYDLGFEFDDFFHPDVLDDPARCESLIQHYESVKLPDTITVHGDFYDVLIFSEDRKIREISELRIRQSMEMAARLGAKGVVFHTNHMPPFKSPTYMKRWTEMNREIWERTLAEFEGMEVYIENMFDDSPYMLRSLARAMHGVRGFGICFDYAHAFAFGREADINEWCRELSPYIRHMHINDNDMQNDLHLAVGDGMIDWDKFAGLLGTSLDPDTILIETSSVDYQRRSLRFLSGLGLVKRNSEQ